MIVQRMFGRDNGEYETSASRSKVSGKTSNFSESSDEVFMIDEQRKSSAGDDVSKSSKVWSPKLWFGRNPAAPSLFSKRQKRQRHRRKQTVLEKTWKPVVPFEDILKNVSILPCENIYLIPDFTVL